MMFAGAWPAMCIPTFLDLCLRTCPGRPCCLSVSHWSRWQPLAKEIVTQATNVMSTFSSWYVSIVHPGFVLHPRVLQYVRYVPDAASYSVLCTRCLLVRLDWHVPLRSNIIAPSDRTRHHHMARQGKARPKKQHF